MVDIEGRDGGVSWAGRGRSSAIGRGYASGPCPSIGNHDASATSGSGAAFLRPLVRRVLAQVDLRVAVAESTRRAVEEVLPGAYALIRPGADPEAYASAPPAETEPAGILPR